MNLAERDRQASNYAAVRRRISDAGIARVAAKELQARQADDNELDIRLRRSARVAAIELEYVEVHLRKVTAPTIKSIMAFVAKKFGCLIHEMRSKVMTLEPVRCRMASMALCKALTMKSCSEIGRAHGGRDHTTVVHAVQKLARFVNSAMALFGPSAELQTYVDYLFAHRCEYHARKHSGAVLAMLSARAVA